MNKSRPVLGDTLARGLAKKRATIVEARLNRIVSIAEREGSQKRQAQFRRVTEALVKAGAVLLEYYEQTKHNRTALFMAPSIEGDGTWDLCSYVTSRQGNHFGDTYAGFTVHVVQRAIQSGISLRQMGHALLGALHADGDRNGNGWLNGWFANDVGLFRIDESRIVTVIGTQVLEEHKRALRERAIAVGGWLADPKQPEPPKEYLSAPQHTASGVVARIVETQTSTGDSKHG